MILRKICVPFFSVFFIFPVCVVPAFADEAAKKDSPAVLKEAGSEAVSPEKAPQKEVKKPPKNESAPEKAPNASENKPDESKTPPAQNSAEQKDLTAKAPDESTAPENKVSENHGAETAENKPDESKTPPAQNSAEQKDSAAKAPGENTAPENKVSENHGAETPENKPDTPAGENAAEENIPTVTAEGDFVVPTYMLQSADTAPSDEPAPAGGAANGQRVVRRLPTVKITQTELTPVAEQMAVERFLTGKTTQTMKAYKEALARQKAATPPAGADLTAPGSKTLKTENKEPESGGALTPGTPPGPDLKTKDSASEPASRPEAKRKKRLLLPLRPLPGKTPPAENLSGTKPLFKVVSSAMADKVLQDARNQTRSSLLMPQDIKVTFYPDSAEFSGQTVKWIKAFALQTLNDPRRIVEIRLSRDNPVLQQKRLYVVQRLLMNSGLSAHQIIADYVNRAEDSLILRMVDKPESVQPRETRMRNGKIRKTETINW